MLQISTTELLILFKNKLCTKNNRQKSKMLIILKVKETILLISSLVPYLYQFHQIKTIHEEVGEWDHSSDMTNQVPEIQQK